MRKPRTPILGAELVVVRRSGLHGRGIFARTFIPKGGTVIEYVGELVDRKEGSRRTDIQWAKGRVYTFELNKKQDIDGSVAWNKARLANSSCDPNCESYNDHGKRILIKALKDIHPGDEITYDYNFPMTEDPLPCRCGAPNCRGFIVGHEYVRQLNAWKRKKGLLPPPKRRKGKSAQPKRGKRPRKKTKPRKRT